MTILIGLRNAVFFVLGGVFTFTALDCFLSALSNKDDVFLLWILLTIISTLCAMFFFRTSANR